MDWLWNYLFLSEVHPITVLGWLCGYTSGRAALNRLEEWLARRQPDRDLR